MRWLVADTLYCLEAFPFGHLDATTHYLKEYGTGASAWNLSVSREYPAGWPAQDDVLFAMDCFDLCAAAAEHGPGRDARVGAQSWDRPLLVAQVAAICNPMPWAVRREDGSPAYDLVLSSIPWMVDEARAAGCRAEYMPLAFDSRALVCGMGVKERDLGCIFIGTVGPNHQRRAQLLAELADVVTVLPPVFGREYFRTLARAKVVFNVHAEWARGALNNMRVFEAAGMGCTVLTDGEGPPWHTRLPGVRFSEEHGLVRDQILAAVGAPAPHFDDWGLVLRNHTYVDRIPRIADLVREVMEAKRA